MTVVREGRSTPGYRAITVSVGLLVVTAALPACSFWAPQVTSYNYAPSDGINSDSPELKIRNMLLVGGDAGGPGALSATLLNQTDQVLAVTLRDTDGNLDATVEVPADGQVRLVGAATAAAAAAASAAPDADLSSTEQLVVIDSVGRPAGSSLAVQVSTPQSGSVTLDIPVVAAVGAYDGYVPAN